MIINKWEGAEMAIKSLELSNVGPFRPRQDGAGSEGIKLEFDANVNLLIGPNNVGKSTILDSICALVGGKKITELFPPTHVAKPGGCDELGYAFFTLEWTDILGDHNVLSGDLHGACGYELDWTLTTLPLAETSKKVNTTREYWNWSLDGDHEEGGYVGYYNPSVRNNYPRTQSRYEHTLSFVRQRRETDEQGVFDKIQQVMAEIADHFPMDLAARRFLDGGYGHYDFFSITVDGEVLSANLSRGTRSILDFVYFFVLDMSEFYYDDSDWDNKPGVFIIDEIDAHLHPSWQRRIIPTLQRHFPNVQIFASTHSPMMVAGLKAGQVHLLKRDETGQVVWSRNEQDIIGWTADEIYRTFMGIEDPTDELTVQRANRLRELRNKETPTDAEEDEMNTLRRQVNQDLLAKGPVNAQSERYADLMHRFLLSLETELSQDGG